MTAVNDIWQGPGSSTTTTAWNTSTNWSNGTVPVTGDSTFLTASAIAIAAYNASAVTLVQFLQDSTYTGLVGAATTYLQIGATTFDLGFPAVGVAGQGSARLNLNIANSGAIVNVYSSAATPNDTGFTPVRLLGTALVLNCTGGTTGVALLETETSSVATLTMNKGQGTPTVYMGIGVTTTTANIYAGTLYNQSSNNIATVNITRGAKMVHNGSGGISTVANIGAGGTLVYNGLGTITLLELSGTLDLSGGVGAVTITNANLHDGFNLIDPAGRAVFTNPFKTKDCRLGDGKINLGFNRNYQVA